MARSIRIGAVAEGLMEGVDGAWGVACFDGQNGQFHPCKSKGGTGGYSLSQMGAGFIGAAQF
jgi:hypothetical protein